MGHFLDVAQKVLSSEGKPLSAIEIVQKASDAGILVTCGKTPWQTMKAKLSTEILRNKDRSLFMRTSQGNFGLRAWKELKENEYVADRFQKALLEEKIIVFPATSLSKYINGIGLQTTPINNGRALIKECSSMLRRSAEEDVSVIQLVTVFILKHKSKYLTYKRTKRLPESRLHDYYSVAFGGHLNLEEIPSLFDVFDPKNAELFLTRELKEEVNIFGFNQNIINYKGLLYDDSKTISQQHLGIVFDVNLETDMYQIGERGFLMDHKFETLNDMRARIDDFENWSVMLIDYEYNQYIAQR